MGETLDSILEKEGAEGDYVNISKLVMSVMIYLGAHAPEGRIMTNSTVPTI